MKFFDQAGYMRRRAPSSRIDERQESIRRCSDMGSGKATL